jgi:hypothetical protein
VSRNFPDWLAAYVEYASFTEAPRRMHFWSGVSAVAGALRRRVWIDLKYFKWHSNMYIILVAPPGVVSKSTTVSIAMNLLRRVPSVRFGPDVVTWQALVTSFANSMESFDVGDGNFMTQCALTLESSEFGNLVDPTNRELVDMLVNLWDGNDKAFRKETKGNGADVIEAPWINIIACTTPAWIAGNFPEYVIGGGFTSRCLFVYADEKEKYVAYPHLHIPPAFDDIQMRLVQDLEHISTALVGPYRLAADAIEWGEAWYEYHWKNKPDELDDDRFSGYLSRKQTHIHKTAMILAAAQRDELVIYAQDLEHARAMVTDLERDMQKVFSRIGRTETSVQAERFIRFVHRSGVCTYNDAYSYVHSAFPDIRSFEGIVKGAIAAGFIEQLSVGTQVVFRKRIPAVAVKKLDS